MFLLLLMVSNLSSLEKGPSSLCLRTYLPFCAVGIRNQAFRLFLSFSLLVHLHHVETSGCCGSGLYLVEEGFFVSLYLHTYLRFIMFVTVIIITVIVDHMSQTFESLILVWPSGPQGNGFYLQIPPPRSTGQLSTG